jgi:hypothetical protein
MSYVWVYLLILLLVLVYLVLLKKKEMFSQSEPVVQTSSSSIDYVTTSALLSDEDEDEDEDAFNIDFSILDDNDKIDRDENSNKLNACLGNHIRRPVKSFRDVSELMFNNIEDCNVYEATEVNITENEGTRYFEQIPYW